MDGKGRRIINASHAWQARHIKQETNSSEYVYDSCTTFEGAIVVPQGLNNDLKQMENDVLANGTIKKKRLRNDTCSKRQVAHCRCQSEEDRRLPGIYKD